MIGWASETELGTRRMRCKAVIESTVLGIHGRISLICTETNCKADRHITVIIKRTAQAAALPAGADRALISFWTFCASLLSARVLKYANLGASIMICVGVHGTVHCNGEETAEGENLNYKCQKQAVTDRDRQK